MSENSAAGSLDRIRVAKDRRVSGRADYRLNLLTAKNHAQITSTHEIDLRSFKNASENQ